MKIFHILILTSALVYTDATYEYKDCADEEIVKLFQEYIQINTTTDNDLTPAVKFWQKLAENENVIFQVHEFHAGYPVIVIKWAGANDTLSGIMLNSHMDVVPADEAEGWTYPPFSGDIDENGNLYGRGTQDTKSIALQYFEALKRLKAEGVKLQRNVYITLMPDEEKGGSKGMIPFLNTDEFKALNVGFEMDEGAAYPLPIIPLFYQDKVGWNIQIDCYGEAIHGSKFPPTNSTATGKCRNVMDALFAFRDEQYEIAQNAEITNAGVYTSINLNRIYGGTANNVIPSQVTLVYDIRLGTAVNENKLQAKLEGWIHGAGENITVTYLKKNKQSPATVVGDVNPYWRAIENAVKKANVSVLPIIPSGSTDARWVRLAGIPAFGFSPMPNTPSLLHQVNEYLNVDTFLKGIDIYKEIITELANIPADDVAKDPRVYLITTASDD